MMREPVGSGRHIPPHERRALMRVEFDDGDWELLCAVFGEEDTARAAAEIIRQAPPEIQILAVQMMDLMKEAV